MANTTTLTPKQFQRAVLTWFAKSGRKDLPWQQDITPYRVWVSEIMLQQTQVKTVIPYYERFMQSYPNINSLANASTDEVMHHWTGLGYYARARNLHKSAKIIVDEHAGNFPTEFANIIALPGIGRSTAGAISAIAYHTPYAILDGNVKRVLARFKAIEGWPGKADVHDALWDIAEHYTPKSNPADYTQAMMDLGAMICTRTKPQCTLCPLQKTCVAHSIQNPTDYPGKKPKKVQPVKSTIMLMVQDQHGNLLLEKRPPTGIWGGLWSFPQCTTEKDIQTWCTLKDIAINDKQILAPFRHTFSHYHLDIQPILISTQKQHKIMDANQYLWYNQTQSIGLAAPVKKLLEKINE